MTALDPWAVSCAGCGAPASISLAHADEVRCGHCGDVRAPEAAVAKRLADGQEALDAVAESVRQLSRTRLRAMHKADNALLLFAGGLGLLLLASPVYLGGGLLGLLNNDVESMLFGCACTNMLLSLCVLVPLTWRRMWSRRRELVLAAAAAPPLRDGGAARCRLCGGDLEALAAGAIDAVVRCSYCDADNLVSSDALALRASHVEADHDDLVATIRDKSRQIDPSMGLQYLVMVGFGMWTAHAVLLLPTMGVVYVVLGLVHGFD